MKNYKTTIVGALLAAVVAIQPLLSTGEIDYKQLVMAALIAALGYFAKDHDVTGGTKGQDTISNPPTL